MSHTRERHEKTCLNCGTAPLIDTYCHHCGQENVEPRQTLWHLIVHFFNDVTHFDGKFFSSMKLLLFRPGFLSSEYVKGRRKKYLDPIRMYLFISAAFFFLLYSVSKPQQKVSMRDVREMRYIDSLRKAEATIDGFQFQIINDEHLSKDVSILNTRDQIKHGERHYDSAQRSLPASERDSWLKNQINKRMTGVYQTYDANPYNFVPNAIDIFWKSLSKIFFISLPIFAFYLFLLFIRRRKQWTYVSHAIFSLHYYCVSFIFLLAIVLAWEISYSALAITAAVVVTGLLVYLFIAMLRYYRQHWAKTLLKFFLLSFFTFITYTFLIIGMFLSALGQAH
jgi:hypothetical protein